MGWKPSFWSYNSVSRYVCVYIYIRYIHIFMGGKPWCFQSRKATILFQIEPRVEILGFHIPKAVNSNGNVYITQGWEDRNLECWPLTGRASRLVNIYKNHQTSDYEFRWC